MADAAPYDARRVANLMLDVAGELRLELRHIALQKLLYFAHAQHLIRYGGPLIRGEFEAWKFGPVHPVAYAAFKSAGAQPIGAARAVIRNLALRTEDVAAPPTDPASRDVVTSVLTTLGKLSVGRLVEKSHAPHGPWAVVVDKARTSGSLGLKIPDSLITERFFRVAVPAVEPPLGEQSEDAPLAA